MRGRARPDEPLEVWCEVRIEGVCKGRADQRHHILRRAQGGTDDKSNTLDVCGIDGCHDFIHRNPLLSYDRGWLRRSGMA